MKATYTNGLKIVLGIGIIGLQSTTSAADPFIDAAWDEGGTPERGVDYIVKTTAPASPELPDVELVTGHPDWRIWSTDPDNPGGLGDIGEISSPHDGGFVVAIRSTPDPESFGARNVKAIRLVPPTILDPTSLIGARITGDLTDEVIVQRQFGFGGGGAVDLVIGGNATANLTVPQVRNLQILGAASGNIMIDNFSGQIGLLRIGELTETGSVHIDTLDVTLAPSIRTVRIDAPMSGMVTVSNIDVGHFEFYLPGGIAPTGILTLGHFDDDPFSFPQLEIFLEDSLAGDIRFLDGDGGPITEVFIDDVDATGRIIADADENGVGDIQGGFSTGKMDGVISSVNLKGLIELGAGSTGSVEMTGDFEVDSDVRFFGDVACDIIANSDDAGGGDILGEVEFFVLSDGEFSGDICGDNLIQPIPPPIPTVLPPNIQLEFGCGGTVCKQEPLCIGPGYFFEAVGSRYLKATPDFGICPMALHVTGAPFNPDLSCVDEYVQATGLLAPTPFYQSGNHWETVYVYGAAIFPDSYYGVGGEGCEEASFAEHSVTTWLWGDVNGDPFVNVDDILCTLDVFSGTWSLPCSFYGSDLVPCEPNQMVDIDDIIAVLDAFSGLPFPCAAPCSGGYASGGGSGQEGSSESGLITFSASAAVLTADSAMTVDVYVQGPSSLRGYQISLSASGGNSGALSSSVLDIETQREDFVFAGGKFETAIDEVDGRLAAALYEGGASVGDEPKYLGTFVIHASSDANGTFEIMVNAEQTKLRDADRRTIEIAPVTAASVTAE